MAMAILLFVLAGLMSSVQGQVSVSGLSSGGYAAVQYHVVYSSELIGCGVIAGGPYWCANGNVVTALTACMQEPQFIIVSELELATSYAYSLGTVDNPSNLQNQKVWLYSGTEDETVVQGVMKKLYDYYSLYVAEGNIQTVFNISSAHAFVTNNYGHECGYFGSPYINNCDFDSAGAMLSHIYGDLNPPTNYSEKSILSIDQANYIPIGYTGETAALDSTAYYFLPSSGCKNTSCKLHITFHGCNQTLNDIHETYVVHTGYNPWAEANNIIVLYPQAIKTLLNPEGCWDWWGYTGLDYATNLAPQMITVNNMVQYLQKTYKIA